MRVRVEEAFNGEVGDTREDGRGGEQAKVEGKEILGGCGEGWDS